MPAGSLLLAQDQFALVDFPLLALRHQPLSQHLECLTDLAACLGADFLEEADLVVSHKLLQLLL